MKYTTKEFKGQPIFQAWADDAEPGADKQFPIVSFGIKKAKAIVESVEQIKAFIAQFDKKEE